MNTEKTSLENESQPSCLAAAVRSFTIDDLRKAFKAGRTVSNYKGEWQETYNDNYTIFLLNMTILRIG